LGEFLLLKIEKKSLPLRDRQDESFNRYHLYRTVITQRFLELQSLQDIAIECGTDSVSLCKSYKKHDTQTPYQHLLRLKMNRALCFLDLRGSKVKDVASHLGFDDPFNFSRTFKRLFGLSPKAYQKKGTP
jgi:AraC-like DNA-binding protein